MPLRQQPNQQQPQQLKNGQLQKRQFDRQPELSSQLLRRSRLLLQQRMLWLDKRILEQIFFRLILTYFLQKTQ